MNPRTLLVLALLTACGLGAAPVFGDSRPVTLFPVASRIIDAHGGVVEVTDAASPLYGSRVEIPAGALSGPTQISINRIDGNAGYPAEVLVTDIEPRSARLAVPAVVTLKYSPRYAQEDGADATVHVISADKPGAMEEREVLHQDPVLRLITIQAPQLGVFLGQSFSNATAKGSYGFATFRFDRAASQSPMPAMGTMMPRPEGFEVNAGTINFDGAGNYSASGNRNTDGVATGFSDSGKYSISSSGATSVLAAHLTGQILSTGSLIAMASTSGSPEIAVMVKSSGSYSNASVSGTYVFTAFRYDIAASQSSAPAAGAALPLPKGFTSMLQTITFDGAGNFTITGTENEDGSGQPRAGSGTYSISPTGVVSVPAANLTGQIFSGSLILLASTSDAPEIDMLVKQTGSFTNASVKGDYSLSGFRFDLAASEPSAPMAGAQLPLPRGITSLAQTLTFDGRSHFSARGSENENGRAVSRSNAGPYSVSSTGVATAPGLSGQVLSGGSVIIMAATSGNPLLVILVRH